MQQFADTIGASPDLPDMLQEVARARELDAFASEHDAQLAFMLRAKRASWSPGYVAQVAAKHGFVPAGPGRMVMPSSIAQMPAILALTYDAQAALADDPDQSALRDVLPAERFVYLADSGNAPYGERGDAFVKNAAPTLRSGCASNTTSKPW